jgi:hypothetical protein
MSHALARVYSTPDMEKMRKADRDEAWTIAATQNVENCPITVSPNIVAYYPR